MQNQLSKDGFKIFPFTFTFQYAASGCTFCKSFTNTTLSLWSLLYFVERHKQLFSGTSDFRQFLVISSFK